MSPCIEIHGTPYKHVAVKVPKTQREDVLKSEVEALAENRHPNIVSVLGMINGGDPGSKTPKWMICLEYVATQCFLFALPSNSESSFARAGTVRQTLPRCCTQKKMPAS